MLSGMQKPKRPRDPNQLASTIIGIAVGEIEDKPPADDRDPAAVALGRKGGNARAAGMSAKRRKQIAREAAKKRWKSKGKE
jgi:hypothetical protein